MQRRRDRRTPTDCRTAGKERADGLLRHPMVILSVAVLTVALLVSDPLQLLQRQMSDAATSEDLPYFGLVGRTPATHRHPTLVSDEEVEMASTLVTAAASQNADGRKRLHAFVRLAGGLHDAVAHVEDDEDPSAIRAHKRLSLVLFAVETAAQSVVECLVRRDAVSLSLREPLSSGEVVSMAACLQHSATVPEQSVSVVEARAAIARWTMVAAFAHGIAIGDYYRATDNEEMHAHHVAVASELLQWSAHTTIAAGTTSAPSSQLLLSFDVLPSSGNISSDHMGTFPGPFVEFAKATFGTRRMIQRRSIAMMEELIALMPKFAPLRLHYAASLTFLDAASTASTVACSGDQKHVDALLRFVHRELQEAPRREHRDAKHEAALTLLMWFTEDAHRSCNMGGDSQKIRIEQAFEAFEALAATSDDLDGSSECADGVCTASIQVPFTSGEALRWKLTLGSTRSALLQPHDAVVLLERLQAHRSAASSSVQQLLDEQLRMIRNW